MKRILAVLLILAHVVLVGCAEEEYGRPYNHPYGYSYGRPYGYPYGYPYGRPYGYPYGRPYGYRERRPPGGYHGREYRLMDETTRDGAESQVESTVQP